MQIPSRWESEPLKGDVLGHLRKGTHLTRVEDLKGDRREIFFRGWFLPPQSQWSKLSLPPRVILFLKLLINWCCGEFYSPSPPYHNQSLDFCLVWFSVQGLSIKLSLYNLGQMLISIAVFVVDEYFTGNWNIILYVIKHLKWNILGCSGCPR